MLVFSVIAGLCIVWFRNLGIAGHSKGEVLFLAVSVLVTVQFQAWASYYEVPLLLNNRMASYYSPQSGAAILRLACAFILYYAHAISSTTMVIVNTMSIVVMGLSYRYLAQRSIEVPRALSKAHT